MTTAVQSAKPDTKKAVAAPSSNPDPDTSANVSNNSEVNQTASAENANKSTDLTGRAVFAVETTAAGVVVRTAFLTEDNRLLNMPAVFPDMLYALNVVDDLRQQVIQHFSQAAQVGAQVIANQLREQQQQTQVQAPAQTEANTRIEPNTDDRVGQEKALEAQGRS
ncbi:hypothetical protein [Orrella daihaiensis]|uniref:Uncharacterized protein n=1 Tax=Orrella daihaiensis TaxID=2782176 RepID=A0ABY4AM91_9BURK|nr:hypothetical protein [Orrella daihaiensis]UOD51294.1 hypothetical protein DHf2319_05240 [Orrella daihaiensis]